ncbi:hypothetical protein DTO013E5_6960 [Penicillium roqueforti]|uniref:Genomic scaffold, ProqFM164S01 n=1 Tax=Penicillium roqueforti (strain FM164) TaxID=1365484 RepID=W6QAV5_PENRF|nr:uncharacterized protein LCP9604111_8316 [Penicillium roqueforti]CDM26847.1 unnamed protein product [Penicillium roqueforti FM164]KAF9241707.1 hypothetical protein LCP9604111_8316 [Penicillium roqueforti]KAI1833604.1 hypothetical protein CBS147337_5643 [Penicillium roqueforti]KAI2672980.1 hypothetical protein CBS147355_7783 [Penicillium roqueforti]KAI2674258.1 hypothetical protein LCP963914a_8874 [Penicillium roqueforti]
MRCFILSVFCTILLLGTISSAWPWRPYGELPGNSLDKRADTTETTTAETSESTTDASTVSKTSTGTTTGTTTGTNTDTNSDTSTDTKTGKTTGTATDSDTTGTTTGTKTGKSKTTTTTSISIDPAAAAGGVSMITPASSSTTYYKIGQDVTFVWNYTSLSVTPSAVNVVASCSLNSMTYTLSSNMSVKQTGSLVWDTGKYQSSATIPLLTASYTLIIYDASKKISDTASAGYLSSQNGGYIFGMYTPQSYTPLNEFKCATCSGALSETSRLAIKFTVGMAVITFASFTWFAGSAGVLTT